MGTKKLEKIALGIGAALCVLAVALLAYNSGKNAAEAPPVQPGPVEPAPGMPQGPDAAAVPDAPGQDGAPAALPPAEDHAPPAASEGDVPPPAAASASNDAPGPANPAPKTDASGGDGLLSEEDARTAALTHAGLAAAEVTFTQQKLEWEDRRQVYDIEFYTPAAEYDSATRTEYDYAIDAATGEVVKFDCDAKTSYTAVAPADSSGTIITQEEARKIALAKVPGASADNVTKLKLDRDDGRQVYEVEIVCNQMEYDLEINAADGMILEFDGDPVHD